MSDVEIAKMKVNFGIETKIRFLRLCYDAFQVMV